MGDLATKIVQQPCLGFSACLVYCRVLLLDIRSSNIQPLDSPQYYLLKRIDADLLAVFEALFEDESKPNFVIISDHPKHLPK